MYSRLLVDGSIGAEASRFGWVSEPKLRRCLPRPGAARLRRGRQGTEYVSLRPDGRLASSLSALSHLPHASFSQTVTSSTFLRSSSLSPSMCARSFPRPLCAPRRDTDIGTQHRFTCFDTPTSARTHTRTLLTIRTAALSSIAMCCTSSVAIQATRPQATSCGRSI